MKYKITIISKRLIFRTQNTTFIEDEQSLIDHFKTQSGFVKAYWHEDSKMKKDYKKLFP